jgi:DNA invertase Pin-like site-specific DNA recombinase
VEVNQRKILRCAIYTRKSSEHGLEQDFNSLDAQREAAEAYIKSQAMRAGSSSRPIMPTGVSRAEHWSALLCRRC